MREVSTANQPRQCISIVVPVYNKEEVLNEFHRQLDSEKIKEKLFI